jgi:phosphoribosylglycinamide formyltransferase-1
MSARLKNIVILISGAGTNMAAIIRAAQTQNWESQLGARVVAVISSHADASGLALAQTLGVATQALDHRGFESRSAFDAALQARIDAHSPALVVLAAALLPGAATCMCGLEGASHCHLQGCMRRQQHNQI